MSIKDAIKNVSRKTKPGKKGFTNNKKPQFVNQVPKNFRR